MAVRRRIEFLDDPKIVRLLRDSRIALMEETTNWNEKKNVLKQIRSQSGSNPLDPVLSTANNQINILEFLELSYSIICHEDDAKVKSRNESFCFQNNISIEIINEISFLNCNPVHRSGLFSITTYDNREGNKKFKS